MDARIRYLSPTEAAKRLGISVKALRLYEQRRLVAPLRTSADWRTYGPEQMARLHQILALKRMGLSLAHIGALLTGKLWQNTFRLRKSLSMRRRWRIPSLIGRKVKRSGMT